MLTVFEGLPGSGKTFIMTKIIRKEWKNGAVIWANYPVQFGDNNDNVHRWHLLDETYHLKQAVIAIDEAQELFGHWLGMPVSFRSKIAQGRKHLLDFYTTTQQFSSLHLNFRGLTAEVFRCESLIRLPKNDRVKPLFQVIRVIKKARTIKNDNEEIKFRKVKWGLFGFKLYFLSRLWTAEHYNTYADVGLSRFVCRIKYEKKLGQKKGKWIGKIYSQDMVKTGKSRL